MGKYPVHHWKLNHRLPISLSSGFRDFIFTMDGVVLEVPEYISSLSLLNSSVYCFFVMGVAGGGSLPLIDTIRLRKLVFW